MLGSDKWPPRSHLNVIFEFPTDGHTPVIVAVVSCARGTHQAVPVC